MGEKGTEMRWKKKNRQGSSGYEKLTFHIVRYLWSLFIHFFLVCIVVVVDFFYVYEPIIVSLFIYTRQRQHGRRRSTVKIYNYIHTYRSFYMRGKCSLTVSVCRCRTLCVSLVVLLAVSFSACYRWCFGVYVASLFGWLWLLLFKTQ